MQFYISCLFLIMSFNVYGMKKKNYETCLDKLKALTGQIEEHRFLSEKQKYFVLDNDLFFNDRDGQLRYISMLKMPFEKFAIYLPNNEYYRVTNSKNDKQIELMSQKNKRLKPLIARIMDSKSIIWLKAYEFLIEKYADNVIQKMEEKKNYKDRHSDLNPDGIREYSALRLCAKAAEIDKNKKLKKIIDKHIKKIPLYSDFKLPEKMKN